uniref:Uncharacterized protein n=1 Tax=Oryza punctata TaxID=4537 RepID=A0A0E0M5K1_ORYPU
MKSDEKMKRDEKRGDSMLHIRGTLGEVYDLGKRKFRNPGIHDEIRLRILVHLNHRCKEYHTFIAVVCKWLHGSLANERRNHHEYLPGHRGGNKTCLADKTRRPSSLALSTKPKSSPYWKTATTVRELPQPEKTTTA